MKGNNYELPEFSKLAALKNQYSKEYITANEVVLLKENDDEVIVAATDFVSEHVRSYLKKYHYPKKIVFVSVSKAEMASFIGGGEEATSLGISSNLGKNNEYLLDSIEQDAPVVNIINAIIIEALRSSASDIHIEIKDSDVCIRYRMDGLLQTVKKLPADVFAIISSRIKIMAKLNIMEQRLPQDGRMSVTIDNKSVDIRVSIIPVSNGEAIAMRIFNTETESMNLDELGFSDAGRTALIEIIKQPFGLILVTGPTGSGKSTTLHALLKLLPAEKLEIITLEDPVEQIMPDITQIQINEHINLTFENMLRRVLRHDPDVIMIGEIRDKATAELCVRAALTGHLILATLHTNDSVSAISRMEDMGIEPYILASVLRCVVAQRLVRKICPLCGKKYFPDERRQSFFKKNKIKAGELLRAAECSKCHNTGYKGRTVVSEFYIVEPKLEELIASRARPVELSEYLLKNGMKTLVYDGLVKCAKGITSFEELEREIITYNAIV